MAELSRAERDAGLYAWVGGSPPIDWTVAATRAPVQRRQSETCMCRPDGRHRNVHNEWISERCWEYMEVKRNTGERETLRKHTHSEMYTVRVCACECRLSGRPPTDRDPQVGAE